MDDEVAAAQTSARQQEIKQEIKETKQEFELAKKQLAAVPKSSVRAGEAKLDKAVQAELDTKKPRFASSG